MSDLTQALYKLTYSSNEDYNLERYLCDYLVMTNQVVYKYADNEFVSIMRSGITEMKIKDVFEIRLDDIAMSSRWYDILNTACNYFCEKALWYQSAVGSELYQELKSRRVDDVAVVDNEESRLLIVFYN